MSIDGLDGEVGACGDGLSTDKLDKSVSVNSPPFDELADVWSDKLGESLPRKEKSDREGGK